jgi:hypothetical protein
MYSYTYIYTYNDVYVLNLDAKSSRVFTFKASLRGPLIFIEPDMKANSVYVNIVYQLKYILICTYMYICMSVYIYICVVLRIEDPWSSLSHSWKRILFMKFNISIKKNLICIYICIYVFIFVFINEYMYVCTYRGPLIFINPRMKANSVHVNILYQIQYVYRFICLYARICVRIFVSTYKQDP